MCATIHKDYDKLDTTHIRLHMKTLMVVSSPPAKGLRCGSNLPRILSCNSLASCLYRVLHKALITRQDILMVCMIRRSIVVKRQDCPHLSLFVGPSYWPAKVIGDWITSPAKGKRALVFV